MTNYNCRIPRNKRRIITVYGVKYEYCVTGFVSVFIRNLSTGEEYKWNDDVKPKWKKAITPADIRYLIVTGELAGIKAE